LEGIPSDPKVLMRPILKPLAASCLLALLTGVPSARSATGSQENKEHCEAYQEARHEFFELTGFQKLLVAEGKAKAARCQGDQECLRGLESLRVQVRELGLRVLGKNEEMQRNGAFCEEVRRQDAEAYRALEAKAAKACTPNGNAELCEDVEFRMTELGGRMDLGAIQVARERYEKAWDEWRAKGLPVREPAMAKPSYDRSIAAHKRYLQDNPTGKRRDLVLYRLAYVHDIMGGSDEAFPLWRTIVRDHPDSRLATEATLRLGESYFARREYDSAIACYGRIEAGQEPVVDERLLGIALLHKGEAFFDLARYDKARDAFFDYVERTDKKTLKRGDLRQEAVLYMAHCFAESSTSYEEAEAFFAEAERRSYEDTLFYELAMKHFDRAQYERAVGAFERLLERWPHHFKAPMVQLDLVQALTKLHRDARAQAVKETLVSTYGADAAWRGKVPKLEPKDRKRLDEAIAGYRLEAAWK